VVPAGCATCVPAEQAPPRCAAARRPLHCGVDAAAAPLQPARSWPCCVQAEGPGRPQPPRRGCGVLGWLAGLPGLARREMARTRARSLAIGDGANDVAMIQARARAPGPFKRGHPGSGLLASQARSHARRHLHKPSRRRTALVWLQAAGGVRLAPSARATAARERLRRQRAPAPMALRAQRALARRDSLAHVPAGRARMLTGRAARGARRPTSASASWARRAGRP